MPSNQYSNEDFNADLDFEIRKKLIFSPDYYWGWVKTPTPNNSFLIHIFASFDVLMLFYGYFRLIKALKVGCYNIRFARIETPGGWKPPPPLIVIGTGFLR